LNTIPSFEFVVPESFLFIPANLSFISFCFFISFIMFRLFRSTIVFIISLGSLLSIMYFDLFFNLAFKTYLETTQMNSSIYNYPQKDENNKIESLSTIRVYNYPLKYSSSLSSKQKEDLINTHESYISNFIDISTYRYRFNQYRYNQERLYLNIYKYNPSFLDESQKKARYTISVDLKKETLFDSYKEFEYKFIDTYTDEILAKSFFIKFEPSTNKLRNRFLYWTREKEESFRLESVQNFDYIYKKIFIDEV